MELHSSKSGSVLPALLVVLALAGGYAWWQARATTSHSAAIAAEKYTGSVSKDVAVSTLVAGAASTSVGFPSAIPVELPNVTESYKAVYENRGLTQYTVSYVSSKTIDELWSAYATALPRLGYSFDASQSKKAEGLFVAKKEQNTLSVAMIGQGTKYLVTINLLTR